MFGLKYPTLIAQNRQKLMDGLNGGAALLFSAPHQLRNGDAEYPYRPSSDVLYLTGWEGEECAVLLRPGAEEPYLLFVQPKDPERETWTGRRYGPQGAVELFGADGAYPIDELPSRLPDLLQGYGSLHYRFAEDFDRDRLVTGAIAKARRKARRNGLDVPSVFVDPGHTLHELRLFKSPEEIEILRKAARITVEAHAAAMAATRPGVHEYEIQALIDGRFRGDGGNGPGYGTIVAGGDNATILHYNRNSRALRDGDLLCVDAGCEYDFYTADVTRTWPVNGKFSAPQAQLYGIVLAAQKAAIEQCVPGNTWKDAHDVATRVLTRGMVEVGLLEAEVEGETESAVSSLIEAGRQKRYYMHGTGHWLGLDVHDVGAYNRDGDARPFEPGMVMTIEPGIYVPTDDAEAPEQFRGIGIRIEDDILVTSKGPENLTSALPREVADIEALVGTHR